MWEVEFNTFAAKGAICIFPHDTLINEDFYYDEKLWLNLLETKQSTFNQYVYIFRSCCSVVKRSEGV